MVSVSAVPSLAVECTCMCYMKVQVAGLHTCACITNYRIFATHGTKSLMLMNCVRLSILFVLQMLNFRSAVAVAASPSSEIWPTLPRLLAQLWVHVLESVLGIPDFPVVSLPLSHDCVGDHTSESAAVVTRRSHLLRSPWRRHPPRRSSSCHQCKSTDVSSLLSMFTVY